MKNGYILAFVVSLTAFAFVSCDNPKYDDYKDIGSWESISDTSSFDGYLLLDKKIYGGFCEKKHIKEMLPHLENSDYKSFQICIGSKYAKDKYQVY